MTRLVLVGSGELAEIALLAAWGEAVTLIGVLDPHANEAKRYGLDVLRSLDEAERCDAVLITDAKDPQRTYDGICALLPASRVLAPPLLKITSDQAELIVAQEQSGGVARSGGSDYPGLSRRAPEWPRPPASLPRGSTFVPLTKLAA